MISEYILGAAIVAQLLTAVIALRLIRATGSGVAWSFICAALVVMIVRRAVPLFRAISGDSAYQFDPISEFLGLSISILLLIGVAKFGRKFSSILQAKHDLQVTHDDLSTIMRTTPQAIIVTDLNGRVTLWNNAAEQIFGWRSNEVLNKPIPIIPEDSTEEAKATRTRSLAGETVIVDEVVRRRKDGLRFRLSYTEAPLRDAHNSITGILTIATDITESKGVEEALRKSKEVYRSLFEHMVEGFAYCKMVFEEGKAVDWIYLSVNAAFSSLTGLKDVVGRKATQAIPGIRESNPELFEIYGRVAQTQQPERFEVHVETMKMWFDISAYSPQKEYFVAVFDVITERKKVEEALRDSRARLSAIIDSAMDAIISIDASQKILVFNPAAEKIFKCSQVKAVGRSLDDFVPERFRSSNRKEIQQFAGTGEASRTMAELGIIFGLRCNGEEFPIEASISRARVANTDLFTIILRDITEREEAEAALRVSDERLRLISENVADLITVLDLEGRYVYNSPSYRSVIGEPAELLGKSAFNEIHPDDRERIKTILGEISGTGIDQRAEFRSVMRDGTIRHIDARGSVIRDSAGTIKNIVVVSRDVTEKKSLEQQFLRAQRLESLGTLAGGIAHDLNNVLAPILLAIEILRKSISGESETRVLATLENSARRGSDIVKQVLAFARGMEGERTLLQPRHLVNEIISIIKETFPRDITVEERFAKNTWTISADATQIHQLLMNLCVNARDAMPKGGTLVISVENEIIGEQYTRMNIEATPGRFLMISVQDNGMGMIPELIDHIFEPFFTTKDPGKGTGLGLSTVHTIVKSHKGFANVYSEPGKGTTFRIYLPASESGELETPDEKKRKLPAGNGELILVVDDEASISQITRQTLEAFGYRVINASDGSQAVALYAVQMKDIALVITDMMMPIMDGAQTILSIRKLNPEAKIIASSGLLSDGKAPTNLPVSANATIAKPYTAEKLLETIRAVLENK